MNGDKYNTENLTPNSERTPSERRANAQAAGIASGVARRVKGKMRVAMEAALGLRDLDGLTKLEKGVLASVDQWIKTGDHQLLNSIRDLIGEKPKDEVDVNVGAEETRSAYERAAAAIKDKGG